MKKPVYVVAHRINGLDEIGRALELGANALECDVRNNSVDHDGQFPWSTSFDDWLRVVAEVSVQNQRLTLLYFDIKTPNVARRILEHAHARLPGYLNVLFSISDYEDRQTLRSIVDLLRPRDGLLIDGCPDPNLVSDFFSSELGMQRSWYAYGLPSARQDEHDAVVYPSLIAAVRMKARGAGFSRVAAWTTRDSAMTARYFRSGVDAVLVEMAALREAVATVESSEDVRVAGRADVAF